jgi:hypothetical protein
MELKKSDLFDEKKDYGESRFRLKSNPKEDLSVPQDADTLDDGNYRGKIVGSTLRLEDGRQFKLKKQTKLFRYTSRFSNIEVKGGKLISINNRKYSGLGEIGGGMQGMSYGNPPVQDSNTRVTVDTEGFRIPKDMSDKFKLRTKRFSGDYVSLQNKGLFTGGINTPSIGISKDNTIIRDKETGATANGMGIDQVPAVALDWDSDRAFHLAIEPWVTSPLMSDTPDGIYIGNVIGDKFETKNKNITLAVKLAINVPENVIALIKKRKAYLFKQSQFAELQTKSKAFSESITTDEEFRSYAHNLMKNAHGDSYSEEKTNKVVDDLLKNHQGSDYGELIGRLKSGMGNKSFSDEPSTTSQGQPAPQTGTQPQQSQPQTPPATQEKPKEDEPKQPKDPDPKEEDQNKNQEPLQQEPDPNPNPSAKLEDKSYRFNIVPCDPVNEMEYVIGTFIMSASIAHLMHLCERDYSNHIALEAYYNRMPYTVDKLAEMYLEGVESAEFKVCVTPESLDPIEYFTKLKEYLEGYQQEKLQDQSKFNSVVDEMLQLVTQTLYKLKRLSNGKKVFSMVQRVYSAGDVSTEDTKDLAKGLEQLLTDRAAMGKPIKVKDQVLSDGTKVKQFVKHNLITPRDVVETTLNVVAGLFDTRRRFK